MATDVGKVIAVYGAGALTNTYRQPLSTTILSRQSVTQVTLAASASATASPSPRVLYGTNNTTTLQRIIDTTVAAPDGRGSNGGGEIHFGPGIYLVKTLALPCSAVGNFTGQGGGNCPRAYNRIALRGAGRIATTLENWDITATTSLLNVGTGANEPDGSTTNPRLSGFEISDLTVRQVANATDSGAKTLNGQALLDARFERIGVVGPSYECLYINGSRVTIRDNYASGCGGGGPGYALQTSAYNILVCTDCLMVNNHFDRALGGGNYAAELGIRRGLIQGNHFTCDPNVAGNGIQFGSNNVGVYDVTILGNDFRNCSIGFTNANGTLNRLYILHNLILNAELQIGSGVDANLLSSLDYPDTVIHGLSVIDGNQFILDGTLTDAGTLQSHAINIGSDLAYGTQESYLIANNIFTVRHTYCSTTTRLPCTADATCADQCQIPMGFLQVKATGGGVRWAAGTACNAGTPNEQSRDYVFPVVYNGYYYRCTTAGTTGTTEPAWTTTVGGTTSDGGATWTNAGRKPSVSVVNNTIQGPDGFLADYHPAPQSEVIIRSGADRDAVRITDLSANYPWVFTQSGSTGFNQEGANFTIPPSARYGDLHRYQTALPTVGYFPINAEIKNVTPSSGHRGWVATRAGRAGSVWQANTAYAFGAWVVAVADNAHVFTQRTAAGCTSANPTEPTWNTSADALTADNTCSWKESGASVLWLEF